MNTSTSALLLTCVVSLGAVAQDAPEQSELGLMQRQIAVIELLADRASSSSVDAAGPAIASIIRGLQQTLDVCVKASANTSRPRVRSQLIWSS